VFGISTPGPADRRQGAPRSDYQGVEYYHNRLGGSSFVMDDGDSSLLRKGAAKDFAPNYADLNRSEPESGGDPTIPHNEMLRLKTRTGHQILLHNAEDLIYIGNAQGTSWIELTSNGKIDIYAEDSISVHTQADINFKADRDINFEAGRDFNVKSGRNLQIETANDLKITVKNNGLITTVGNLDINTELSNRITAGQNTDILSINGNHTEQTPNGKVYMNGPDAVEASIQTGFATWTLPGDPRETIDIVSILRRVPQHEPWPHHENLNPAFYTPTETDVKKQEDGAITINPPETAEYKSTADTFRKGS